MAKALLVVFVVFSCVVGFGLANNNASVWSIYVFMIAGVVALQISYLASSVILAR